MILKLGDEEWSVRSVDTHRHKYNDAMSEYIDLRGSHDSWFDTTSGDVESPTGWFALVGKRILYHDERGFVWVVKYGDAFGARQVFDAMSHLYDVWSHDEWDASEDYEEWDEVRAMEELHTAKRYLAYVNNCEENACIAYDLVWWTAFGMPEGCLG